MSLTSKADALLQLAKSRDPADRERLLGALLQLCQENGEAGGELAAPVKALMESIFMALVLEAELDIRKRLALRLADADWAPGALINALALDDIEIAQPIIARSPILKDQDLINLLLQCTIEHQIEVARRPQLAARVVDEILRRDEPAVLIALASNDTADISGDAMARLVETSRRIAALRAPLVRHPRLSAQLAEQLYAWVGQSLRSAIVSRYHVDPVALEAAIAAAVKDAHGGAPMGSGPTVVWERAGERESMEVRLIDKLASADQLRPGYLIRVLKERKLSLFQAALAKLGGFDVDQVRRATASADRPELLALACAAVGIDRSVFPTILLLVRDINGGRPGGGPEAGRRAINAFGPFSPDIAANAFRQAVAAV